MGGTVAILKDDRSSLVVGLEKDIKEKLDHIRVWL